MELDTMYDSDVSSTLLEIEQHGEDLSLEDVDVFEHDATTMPSMTALAASSSPKTAEGGDLAWLRRLEREMDTKLLLDAEKINDRIQRRKAHEEEMQQSLASFTLSGRQSSAVSSVQSSSKSSESSLANVNASTESTNHSRRQETAAAEAAQPLQPVDEWKEAFTEDGKKYFYNRRTRETSWTCPDNAIVVNRSDGATPTAASTASDPATADSSAAACSNPTSVTMQQANQTMYCMFCGTEWRVWELMAHMATCDVLQSHKDQRTAMYEEAVEIASELFVKQTIDVDTQTSDRYLHYASVYSVHHGTDDDDGASSSAERAHVDPLALLKQRRRHTLHPTTRHEPAESRHDDDVMQLNVDLDTKLSLLRLKRTTEVAARRQDAFEQCRYCHRSFAEGRLSKHEAVCPRVFGTETTWNNHQASRKGAAKATAKAASSKRPKPPSGGGGGHVTKSSLAGSFLEYQATLVTCPCCQRKFAPSGAQQHIDICQHVENKPKKMMPKSYAIAG